MITLKVYLTLFLELAVFLVWHHYAPIPADILGVVLVIVGIVTWAQIYFASVESKRKSIVQYKVRHQIPLDQPHKIDTILKWGYFRAD